MKITSFLEDSICPTTTSRFSTCSHTFQGFPLLRIHLTFIFITITTNQQTHITSLFHFFILNLGQFHLSCHDQKVHCISILFRQSNQICRLVSQHLLDGDQAREILLSSLFEVVTVGEQQSTDDQLIEVDMVSGDFGAVVAEPFEEFLGVGQTQSVDQEFY